jgi:hypothetical protein
MSRIPYSKLQGPGKSGSMPFVPVRLYYASDERHLTEPVLVPALVDSGAAVNVIPRDVGEQFGLDWDEQKKMLKSAGMVRGAPTLGLFLWVKLPEIEPIELLFAWSKLSTGDMRVILGQIDFFDEFFIDFRKPRGYFEIALKDE